MVYIGDFHFILGLLYMSNFWKEVAVVDCLSYHSHKALKNSEKKKLHNLIRVGGGRVIALKVVMIWENTIIHHL